MAGSSGVTIIITSSIDGRLRGAQLCLFMLLDTMTFDRSVCIPSLRSAFDSLLWTMPRGIGHILIWSEFCNNAEIIKEFAQN